MSTQALFLASTSLYRKALLEKLTPNFSTAKPEVDETALPGETPEQLVSRLAVLKAQAVANSLTEGLVIGSDQVAVFNGQILGKPHTAENAYKQLKSFSGNSVIFLTGLALVNAHTKQYQLCVEPFQVHFRELTDAEIIAYIEREQPLNCAGSFKSEGLGISLFKKLEGDDPNSLIGLPLIRLLEMLRNEGRDLLTQP
jgi:MAF protein